MENASTWSRTEGGGDWKRWTKRTSAWRRRNLVHPCRCQNVWNIVVSSFCWRECHFYLQSGVAKHNLELPYKDLHLQVESLMEMFSGGPLEHKVMQKAGCIDYSATEWELVGCNIQQRQTSYKFDKSLSRYGGEATTTQQKYSLVNRDGWAVEEVMTLQGVLLGDYFNVRFWFSMHHIQYFL